MTKPSNLERTASRIEELARPRASAWLVGAVVLAAEVFAAVIAWGVSTLDQGAADPILITIVVVAAAVTALTLLLRTGDSAEPGNQWLAAAWLVIAVLAGGVVTELPLALTTNPAGPGFDRALLMVLAWTLVLAIGVVGADLRPNARVLPWVLVVVFGVGGLSGGLVVPEGALLSARGPTFGYGLLAGMIVVLAVGSAALWIARWTTRGGWALTWTGVGLVLMTISVMFQLLAPFGSDRAWAAATALLLSSLVVPAIGAGVAALGMAGANNLARRQLAQDLEATPEHEGSVDQAGADGTANLPILEALDVQLATVVTVATLQPRGAMATASLPGTHLSLDWWRAQAGTMNLAERFEIVLATRALGVARRERADAWLVLPVSAAGLSPSLMDVLTGPSAGQLVAVVDGVGKTQIQVLQELRSRGINTGIAITAMDQRVIEAVRTSEPSMVVVKGPLVAGLVDEERSRAILADIVAFADDHSIAVMVEGLDDVAAMPVLRELGVRYATGQAVLANTPTPTGTGSVAPVAMELIEAAGLREQAAPGHS